LPDFRATALNSRCRAVDTHSQMIKPVPPMSNTERQRRFRERNPGYYGRLHRKRSGGTKRMLEQQRIAAHAAIDARYQAEKAARAELLAQAKAIVASFNRVPLMLPAPAPPNPLAGDIAALAEARKARAAAVCKMKVAARAMPDAA
jgi:hypothetical protein